MYHEIHKLSRFGFSNAKIARYLVLDHRTVKKTLNFTEQEYELHLLSAQQRNKILTPYENFVYQKLEAFHDTTAAQMHDWLKEHYPDFEKVSVRTVFNFVMFVRQKYNIPLIKVSRQYFPVEELPYGKQAQVDFGSYNMRMADGRHKKINFFAMVLSRSRMKYIWFIDKPFTAQSVCQAHENAFHFFDGITEVIVYDQDRTMIVDENMGDIILTATFKQYTRSRNFALHFCRKSDPESKGKVENVIQFVKKNFLFNRSYLDQETLNAQALAWLARTANALEHNYTKKSPQTEYEQEKSYLKKYIPMNIDNKEDHKYHVRKTNTIAYKSNFYTLPMGTYKGTGTQVHVKEMDGVLQIYNEEKVMICNHEICTQKGQTIINNNHKRDTSKRLDQLIEQTLACFSDKESAGDYISQIKKRLPRYVRDNLQAMQKSLDEATITGRAADEALIFCHKNSLFSGYEFDEVLQLFLVEKTPKPSKSIKLLDKNNLEKAAEEPQKSNIEDYEYIINQ
jgi:hypothetical protein